MIANNPVLILCVFGLGCVGIVIFAVGLFRGWFDAPREQALVIFDSTDYRLHRPWETPDQLAARRRQHGDLLPPEPGEWGGAR